VSANLEKDIQLLGTMDPYVVVNWKEKEFKGLPHVGAGKSPVWNFEVELFVFPSDFDKFVYIKVMNDNVLIDNLIAKAKIPISNFSFSD